MKIIVIISFLLLTNSFTFSQTGTTIPKDSIAVWELKKISPILGLSGSQEADFLLANKTHFNELEDINKKGLNPADRKLAIEASKKAFNEKLQTIFTKEQYDKYKTEQQKHRQKFMDHQKEKKVTVVEINDDL